MKALKWPLRHYLVASFCFLLAGAILFEEPTEERPAAEVLLYATREAPIGGEYVKLYDNDSIEFGLFALRNSKSVTAGYRLEGDTIRIKYGEKDTIRRDEWLRISGDKLERKSSAYFSIGINKLKEGRPADSGEGKR